MSRRKPKSKRRTRAEITADAKAAARRRATAAAEAARERQRWRHTKSDRLLKGMVGGARYEVAILKYGSRHVHEAAKAVRLKFLNDRKRRQAKLGIKAMYFMSARVQVARLKLPAPRRFKPRPKREFRRVLEGPQAGMFVKEELRRDPETGVVHRVPLKTVSLASAKRGIAAEKYWKHVDGLAATLLITKTEARELMKSARDKGEASARKIKSSKKWLRMSPKQRRHFNIQRQRIAAEHALLVALGVEESP